MTKNTQFTFSMLSLSLSFISFMTRNAKLSIKLLLCDKHLRLISSLPLLPLLFRIRIGSLSSRRQTTLGCGCPVARHTNVASSPSCTAMSVELSSLTISGGTVCGERNKLDQYLQLWVKLERILFICKSTHIHSNISHFKSKFNNFTCYN
jgi:hypothetical protein